MALLRHYSNYTKNKRRKLKDNSGNQCKKCRGIYNKDTLQIHHQDGNWKNNEVLNLIVVCRKCHPIEDRKVKVAKCLKILEQERGVLSDQTLL